VLFTDLVGSTQLASGLTSEEGDALRRAHFSSLREAIAAFGGTEVKNLGDGLMVIFPSASGALSCAVAIQQAVDRDNRRDGRALALRVGLSCGEATREGDDWFGDPVIEAARLCSHAEGHQILAAAAVRVMAGRRSLQVLRSLGQLELKGLPEPIEAFEVGWDPLPQAAFASDQVPLPSRLELAPPIGIVGRDTESTVLADAFKRVAGGSGREVVLVAGEPGIGKTTLGAQLAREAFASGACVLLGRCDEEVGVPYAQFVEALGYYVSHAAENTLRAHVYQHGANLSKIVPALAERWGELPVSQIGDPDSERYLLYAAVAGLLGLVSTTDPLVLILEDLQWADKPSLQLLRYLVASEGPNHLLVVGTYRPSELSGGHPLTETLGALRREPGVSSVALGGLDDLGVIQFVEAAARHELDDANVELARALYRETDGNPFFVGEVLRHLSETGAVSQDRTGRWRPREGLENAPLPDSVRQVIASRVAHLGSPAAQVLPVAAVIGREFDLDLLARATERPEDELIDALEGATAAALVGEVADAPGRYAFAHALIQHTLYRDMGATRRARAHRRVAEAIEAGCRGEAGARVSELAYHWANATQPVDVMKAVGYARQAAETALAALAPDEAVRHFTTAIGLLAGQPGHDQLLGVDLKIGLATAQRQAGIPAFRETFLDAANEAKRLGATDRLVRAALGNSRDYVSAVGVIDRERVAVLEAALDVMSDQDSTDRALLLAMLCAELAYGSPLDRRRALADSARAMARRLGDPATLVHVVQLTWVPLCVPWLQEERLRDSVEALALAESLGAGVGLAFAAHIARANAIQGGDFETAARNLEILRKTVERVREPSIHHLLGHVEVAEALFAGEPDRAESLVNATLELGTETGQPDALIFYSAQLAIVRHQQGRLGELAPLLERFAEDNPGLPFLKGFWALASLEAGDTDQALELLEEASRDEFASVPEDIDWLDALICFAEVAIELRVERAARSLYDLLAPYSEQIPYEAILPHPPIALYLGALASLLRRDERPESHFRVASEISDRRQMKFAQARTMLAWGRVLAGRRKPGDPQAALAFIEQARSSARNHGYAMVERRATMELSRLT
jgi:class 3 adenylate cyclase